MVESDAFLPTAEQRMQEQALYAAALYQAAEVLRGPTGRGTPAKAKTVRRFVRDRLREAKHEIKRHVINMRGFRPVLDYEPKVPEHIKAMWEGVP